MASIVPNPDDLRELRERLSGTHPHLTRQPARLRLESIRTALAMTGSSGDIAKEAYGAYLEARRQVTPYRDVHPALAWLSARFPLVALSNGNSCLEAAGLAGFFTGAVFAQASGQRKPCPSIFLAAAMEVGVRPSEMLHVGDDFLRDVMGAWGAGMQAVWLVRADHAVTLDDLKRRDPRVCIVPDLGALCRALGKAPDGA